MTYIIIKIIHGFKYYWNEQGLTWEGLIDNATEVGESDFNRLMDGFEVSKKKNEIFTYCKK